MKNSKNIYKKNLKINHNKNLDHRVQKEKLIFSLLLKILKRHS